MSVDRTKILEAAQKHLEKGALDKAILEFQKLVKADPTDVRTWLKIGDLHAKRNATKDAVETYIRVADHYASQGAYLKAVAVHKQILKLDATRVDVQLKLADAYQNLQLASDALAAYEQVAASYARSGQIEQALSTLAKMVALDPENIPIRIKYAEALSRASRAKEAAAAFEAGGKLLKAQGRLDDYIKVAERLMFHRPDDVAVARELAGHYLERKDAKRALTKLQVCFKADPKDVPTLEMLAEAFHQLGQLPKTLSVYKEIARIHHESARPAERARTLQRILELDPGDAEARQALAAYAQPARRDLAPPSSAVVGPSVRPGAPDSVEAEVAEDFEAEHRGAEKRESAGEREGYRPSQAEEYEEPLEEDEQAASSGDLEGYEEVGDSRGDVLVVDDDDPIVTTEPPTGAVLSPDVSRDAQIAKLLTECDVFRRYGLRNKVVEQLRKVLEIDPEHVAAREELRDMLIELGQIDAAILELFALADLFAHSRGSVAALYLKQIIELDPENDEARGRLDRLRSASMRPSAVPPLPREPRVEEATPAPEEAPVLDTAESFPDEPVMTVPGAPVEASATAALSARPSDGVFFVDEDEPPPEGVSAAADGTEELAGDYAAAPGLTDEAEIEQSHIATPVAPAMPPPAPAEPVVPPSARVPQSAAHVPAPRVPLPGPRVPAPARALAVPTPVAAVPRPVAAVSAAMPGPIAPPPQPEAEAALAAEDNERAASLPPEPTVAAEALPELLDEASPGASSPESGSEADDDLLQPFSPEEFEAAPLRPSTPEDLRATAAVAGEVEELLDEADFYVAQGLYEEALTALREALVEHPRNRLIADKLAEVEELAAETREKSRSLSSPPADDQSFLLAEKLAEEIDGAPASREGAAANDVLDVEQVFAQFKKGVEQQVGLEDVDTHFDLGIAYKEMGLTQDAIAEFELCVNNEAKECIAHTMIGLCYVELGDVPAAIGHFKKGLYASVKTDREELGLYYELGRAHELLGDPREALFYYEKVRKRDPEFRNVNERVLALTRPAPAAPPAAPPTEDLDAAFDDLVGEREE